MIELVVGFAIAAVLLIADYFTPRDPGLSFAQTH